MKSHLSRIMLSILILSLALHAFALPAQAQSEPNENQARFENIPPELAERYQNHSEIGERPEFTPPTPEIIAKTQAQVKSFDCASVTDVSKIECEALVDLYGSTNGAGWWDNSNWLESTSVSTWYGVAVNSRVVSIDLYDNALIGSIPSTIGNLTGLLGFYLDSNQLTGSIPSTIGKLSNLKTLLLQDNELTGSIPAEMGNLSNLENLRLNQNQLTGSIPTEMGNLSNLWQLDLKNNLLTSNLPSSLGKLSNLKSLYLQDNQLTGSIPAELGGMSDLGWLDLSYNQLTGNIPAELGDLSNLDYLFLNNNQLTGSIPAELGSLSNLNHLFLSNNLLTGDIPAELGNMSDLGWLDLNYNQLTGSIPSELGNLSKLGILNLSYNQLTGSIPAELGGLSNLWELYLSNNLLTGSIPAEIGQLTQLRYLNLNENLFEGDIPISFVDLENLNNYGLDLGYNRFNVPQEEPVASFLEDKNPDWHLTQAIKVTIPGESGGIIQSRDDWTKIEIPAGAYTGEMTFHFIPHSSPRHPLNGLMQAHIYFELLASVNGEPVSNFNLPLTITINYAHVVIWLFSEDSLNLYHWNSDRSAWNNAISTCPGGEYVRNQQEDWLSLPLCELGEFALLGKPQNIYLPLIWR